MTVTVDQLAGFEAARRERILELNARLREAYGSRHRGERLHPTDSLIDTILSQHTADRNSAQAFEALKRRYPTWQDVAEADRMELADTIRCAGLGNLKAQRIQETLYELERRFGSMDLGFLRELPMEEARSILLSLPGVGPKTAACVLLFSCDQPAFPVDTHVHRLARRLGLIGPKTGAEETHRALQPLIPPEDVYDFHVNLIAHGRTICRARDPRCEICVLRDCCNYVKGKGAKVS